MNTTDKKRSLLYPSQCEIHSSKWSSSLSLRKWK